MQQFCKKHLQVKDWKKHEMRTYSKTELFCLLDMVIELFKKEKTLAEISPPVTIVGDIHGQFEDLVRLLNTRNSSENAKSKPIYGFSTKK